MEITADRSTLTDAEAVRRVLAGDVAAYEIIVRRYNQRLYRIARSLVGESEAEDVMQEAYVLAFQHLASFEGRASFATWLTRIAVHEAYRRMKLRQRYFALDVDPESYRAEQVMEQKVLTGEAGHFLEQAIDALPEMYRAVFVMRDVEGLDTGETAASLGIARTLVKVRLSRARRMLRDALAHQSRAVSAEAFQFLGSRCNRMTAVVFARISSITSGTRISQL